MGPLESEISGVKCDAKGCGWSDMSVPRSAFKAWRNAACPSCGANVFTDADWKAMRRIEIIVGVVNALFFFLPRPKQNQAGFVTSYSFDGRGLSGLEGSRLPPTDQARDGAETQKDHA